MRALLVRVKSLVLKSLLTLHRQSQQFQVNKIRLRDIIIFELRLSTRYLYVV